MDFRFATSADINHIATLHANSWRIAYADALSAEYLQHHADQDRLALWTGRLVSPANNQRVIVLEESGELLGFVCIFLAADPELGSLIDILHVVAKCHRRSLGTTLMKEASRVISNECAELPVHLGVVQSNVRAQRFYQKLGGKQKDDYIWNSPDGGKVPCYLYVWPNAAAIASIIS